MADALADLLRPERLTVVVDVGANPIDSAPPYRPLLEKRLCRVFGFEPQPEALARLNAAKSDLETYLPDIVGDGEPGRLRVCRASGMTSLLMPDPRMLRQFAGFPAWGQVVREIDVTTRRLDDIGDIDALDFLKMDVQGSELALLRHGRARLAGAVAVQSEVSFLPLYRDQPVFGDIDLELRAQGFVPHAFVTLNKRLIAPLAGATPYDAINQLLEADVLYVRDFTRPETMTTEQFKHLALIAHHCYGSFDLAANCIHRLAAAGAILADALERYVEALPKPAGA
jgi:FkbM family methyltransferase